MKMVNNMENADEVMQVLDRFTRLKQKEIPKELDDYLHYVAKTGDTVFKWSNLKYLFREKLLNVIKNFHDTSPRVDEIPQYPNVDPFNYENMKSALLERLELFNAAPFTIQRLCELLIDPRKQYSRIDKFMRALEKNILVVSTIEPGRKRTESENGDSLDSVVNGDLSLDVNVDIDMENDNLFNIDQQNGNGHVAHVEERPEEVDSRAGGDSAKVSGHEEAAAKPTDLVQSVGDGDVERKIGADNESLKGRARDDPTQAPNPKKPKLDLPDEKEVETKDETPVEETKKPLEARADAESPVTKEKDAESGETLKKTDPKDLDDNKEQSVVKQTTCEKQEEQSETIKKTEKKDSEEKQEKDTRELEKATPSEKIASTEGKETAPAATTEKSDAVEKKATDAVQSVEVVAAEEAEEKIIEKQEIEKCEKEVVADTEKAEAEVVSTTTLTATDTKAEPECAPLTVANIDGKSEEAIPKDTEADSVAAAPDAKAPSEQPDTCEISPSTTATTDTAEKDVKEKLQEAEDDKTSSIAKDSNEEKEADSTTAQVSETKPVAVEKVEANETILPADDGKTDKSEIVEDTKTPTPSETAESAAAASAEAKVVDVDSATTATATETVSSSTASADKEVGVAATSLPIGPIEAVAPPSLALNDQPMEEVPQDDVSPTADNEVVMAETISSTAMTTEAMDTPVAEEPEEPSGMEVDDTSPPIEEMDQ